MAKSNVEKLHNGELVKVPLNRSNNGFIIFQENGQIFIGNTNGYIIDYAAAKEIHKLLGVYLRRNG